MPELFLQANEFVKAGKFDQARAIQSDINDIIIAECSFDGSMYAVIKEVLKRRGVNVGGVRAPFENLSAEDAGKIDGLIQMIDQAIAKHCE
ncbi:N-acetylneuraminate lyase [compost metagenome]